MGRTVWGFAGIAGLAGAMLVGGCLVADDGPLVLAEGGRTEYTFVHPDNLATGDVFVVKDVTGLLARAIGQPMAVTNLSAAPKAKCIYYGIPPAGFDTATLAEQEHCIFTAGGNLHLFGGGPNGARYAAYSLLQKDLGFRFFDTHGGVKVPKGALRLPPMKARRQFPFRFRYLNGESGMFNRPDSTIFLVRHGQNSWSGGDMKRNGTPVPPDECRILHPHAHSLRYYLPADAKEPTFKWIKELKEPPLKETHPEYFTLSTGGKRVFDSQYCLSNPGCRKLLKERVLENMRRNPSFNVFDLSAGDTPGEFCHCKGCKALMEKYGTVAGPLVDFILELCPEVKAKFPDNIVMSLAYRKRQTQPPPKTLDRLPDNFMPDFAPIDDNFAKDWTDPSNTNTYADLLGWSRLCRNVMVWYYPNPYTGPFVPPLGNLERAVNDLLLMEKAGVTAHIWEHNVGVSWNIGFTELQTYVLARMMNDTSLDWRQLADEFIAFEYGAAAEAFKRYWMELEELRKTTMMSMTWNAAPTTYRHLTPERLVRWNGDFDRMEALVKDDPERLYAVQRVRVNLDWAILSDFRTAKKAGLKISADDLAARILATAERVAKDFCTRRCDGRQRRFLKHVRDAVEAAKLQNATETAPLPADIFGKIKPDRIFSTIPKVNGSSGFEKDPDAAYGIRAVFTNNGKGAKLPLRGAFEDHVTKGYKRLNSVKQSDLPPRGKYRFYSMGTFTLSVDCIFRFGVDDWWDFKADVSRAWEFGSHNRATGWISMKFEGPAFYPEDAGKPNRIFCDRMVIVRE